MPLIRRWRGLILLVTFVLISLYYISNRRNTWNYGYTSYVPPLPATPNTPPTHWKAHPDHFPVTSFIPLPTQIGRVRPPRIPNIQGKAPEESAAQKSERLKRRAAAKESFYHSWTGYKTHAWLKDEVAPISGKYKDSFGGWAATLVDSLDTLWIMGLKQEFTTAVKAAEKIDFTKTEEPLLNVFETTIRYLGGFLGAFDVSGQQFPTLLAKAVQVADLLMSCFDTPNRMPITRWDWQSYTIGKEQKASNRMLVSELGSLSLEFTRLSQITKNPKYYDAVQRISNVFYESQNSTLLPGMWPVSIDAAKPAFDEDTFFTLGGMSDSLYEYFPKQYLVLGGFLTQPKEMYVKFIEVAKKHLFFRIYNPKNQPLTVSGDIRVSGPDLELKLKPRGQHLTCFTGGMVGLASKIFSRPDDLKLAEELTDGCVWAYDSQVNGVAPEIFSVIPCPKNYDCNWSEKIWHDALPNSVIHVESTEEEKTKVHLQTIKDDRLPPGFTRIDDRRYILRPEAIESVFMMYRLTGSKKWQDIAWRMFQAIEKISRTEIAAAAIHDVTRKEGEEPGISKMDSMESFWLAETLKYFYLVFEEWDVVSLDEFVLNTEAHPLKWPRRKEGLLDGTIG